MKKQKLLLNGNSDIKFEMRKCNNTELGHGGVGEKYGKFTMDISYEESVVDIYTLVHELSHTFDLDLKKESPTRQMLGEVTPFCFEHMLDYYLIERGIVNKNDVANRQKRRIVSSYNDGMDTFAKIELMKVRERKNIDEQDIINLQQRYKLTDEQVEKILNDVLRSSEDVHFRARYMTAQLICLRYIEQYDKNPSEAIKSLKEYFELVKKDDFASSLEKVGVDVNPNGVTATIEELVAGVSKRLEEVDKVINAGNKSANDTKQSHIGADIDDDGR